MGKFCFGVDIGGTSVKMGMFSEDGSLIKKWEIKTSKETALEDVAASVKEHLTDEYPAENCAGIGIDVPGPVVSGGIVLECVNLGWSRTDVKGEMERLCGLPTFVGNDADVAALGEMWQGGGKGYANQVMITLGTGVGGGVILGGKILDGSNGAGGEIGHMVVNYEETDVCGCGKRGCLEQYASATGIVRLARKAIEAGAETCLKNDETLSAKAVLDAAKAGDPLGLKVLDQLGWYLAVACANIAQVVDPQIFVIGGGVSAAGKVIIDAIEKYYDTYVMHSLKGKPFILATLGNDAGIYGCAGMVFSD